MGFGDVYLKIRHASAFVALGKVTRHHCCLKFMWWVPLLSAFVWLEKVFEGLERCLFHVEKVQETTRIGSSRGSPSLLGVRSLLRVLFTWSPSPESSYRPLSLSPIVQPMSPLQWQDGSWSHEKVAQQLVVLHRVAMCWGASLLFVKSISQSQFL